MPKGPSKSVAGSCLGILDCTCLLLVLADIVGCGSAASCFTPFVVCSPVRGTVSFFTVAFGEVSLVARENASSCCTSDLVALPYALLGTRMPNMREPFPDLAYTVHQSLH